MGNLSTTLNTFDDNGIRDHRDFPRLAVEAKVRILGLPTSSEEHAPVILSDLSLGGARLASQVELQLDQELQLIPFAGLDEAHPLHKGLNFTVVWQTASDSNESANQEWEYYGLRHQGSVLEILESWLGHLLLRRHKPAELVLQRRHHRRLRLPDQALPSLKAIRSHDRSECALTLIDVAPGGLLARGDGTLPVGMHLQFQDPPLADPDPLFGSIVDAHSYSGSTFYRVSFDPDSELDEERIIDWATTLGGTFE